MFRFALISTPHATGSVVKLVSRGTAAVVDVCLLAVLRQFAAAVCAGYISQQTSEAKRRGAQHAAVATYKSIMPLSICFSNTTCLTLSRQSMKSSIDGAGPVPF